MNMTVVTSAGNLPNIENRLHQHGKAHFLLANTLPKAHDIHHTDRTFHTSSLRHKGKGGNGV